MQNETIKIRFQYVEDCTNYCSTYVEYTKEELDEFRSFEEFEENLYDNMYGNSCVDDSEYGDIHDTEMSGIDPNSLQLKSMDDIKEYFESRGIPDNCDSIDFNGVEGFACPKNSESCDKQSLQKEN
jgi:hypothetical protein